MHLKRLVLAFSVFGSLGLMAEEQPDLIVVWTKDGAKPTFSLREQPKISFTSNELVLKTTSVEVAYDLSQLLRLTYECNAVSGVEDLMSAEQHCRLEGDALCFPCLPEGSVVKIFRIDGTSVLQKRVDRTGAYAVNLEGFLKGNYIVKAQGVTYKFTKR